MCLSTLQSKPEFTNEDIVVYKLLTSDLVSPWYNFQFELNKVFEDPQLENSSDVFQNIKLVGVGYFHSFDNLDSAKRKYEFMSKRYPKIKFAIYKAVIPKGSSYYSGLNKDLCSKKIKLECVMI